MPSGEIVCLDRYRNEIDRAGFALVPDLVSPDEIETLCAELTQLSGGQSARRGRVYAARNLLATAPAVAALARGPRVRPLVEAILGSTSFPVRGILFDKVPGANWHVGWHQDQIIPVANQRNVPGFAAWSVKHGVPHVQPPAAVLERMLTLRIHLDDCDAENGALRVIPESHRRGLLSVEQIRQIITRDETVVCEARRGSVLAMRPLLLHASSPATSPSHRRVVHLEFAAEPLPGGLEWPRQKSGAGVEL